MKKNPQATRKLLMEYIADPSVNKTDFMKDVIKYADIEMMHGKELKELANILNIKTSNEVSYDSIEDRRVRLDVSFAILKINPENDNIRDIAFDEIKKNYHFEEYEDEFMSEYDGYEYGHFEFNEEKENIKKLCDLSADKKEFLDTVTEFLAGVKEDLQNGYTSFAGDKPSTAKADYSINDVDGMISYINDLKNNKSENTYTTDIELRKKEIRARLKKQELTDNGSKVSGVAVADKIAEDMISGKEKRTTTREVGKELSDKIKKEYALSKKQKE